LYSGVPTTGQWTSWPPRVRCSCCRSTDCPGGNKPGQLYNSVPHAVPPAQDTGMSPLNRQHAEKNGRGRKRAHACKGGRRDTRRKSRAVPRLCGNRWLPKTGKGGVLCNLPIETCNPIRPPISSNITVSRIVSAPNKENMVFIAAACIPQRTSGCSYNHSFVIECSAP
jgi:hypothetical protein